MAAKARGYGSDRDVWQAIADKPGLAVVDGIVAPRRDDWSAGAVLPDFKLQGFVVEDGVFDPIPVATRDPQTGKTLTLTVIGVLEDSAPQAMFGLSTSQETLAAAYGHRVRPTAYYYDLAPGVDARATAPKLEAAFVANGLEADAIEQIVDDAIGIQLTFNRLIEGFMGLGLIVGIAALGVVSARAVVERRQQIGILRALGFRRRMIRLELPDRIVVHRTDGDRGRDRARADRRQQRRGRRREPGELAGPRPCCALAQPDDHFRRGLCGGAGRHASAGGARLARLPGGGVAL